MLTGLGMEPSGLCRPRLSLCTDQGRTASYHGASYQLETGFIAVSLPRSWATKVIYRRDTH